MIVAIIVTSRLKSSLLVLIIIIIIIVVVLVITAIIVNVVVINMMFWSPPPSASVCPVEYCHLAQVQSPLQFTFSLWGSSQVKRDRCQGFQSNYVKFLFTKAFRKQPSLADEDFWTIVHHYSKLIVVKEKVSEHKIVSSCRPALFVHCGVLLKSRDWWISMPSQF